MWMYVFLMSLGITFSSAIGEHDTVTFVVSAPAPADVAPPVPEGHVAQDDLQPAVLDVDLNSAERGFRTNMEYGEM